VECSTVRYVLGLVVSQSVTRLIKYATNHLLKSLLGLLLDWAIRLIRQLVASLGYSMTSFVFFLIRSVIH
jgi:hypothetical protein